MSTGRKVALVAAIIAEILTLVAIVLVFRSNSWHWSPISWVGGFGPQAQEERVISLDGLTGPLRIYNNRGKIRVTSKGTPPVAKAKVYGFGVDKAAAQASLSSVEITTATDATGTTITVKAPDGIGRMPFADLEVVVPVDTMVIAEAGMGSVKVDDFTGTIHVIASMGQVDINHVQGNIEVSASMGSVELREVVIRDNLQVDAAMGSISFRGTLGKQNSFAANMGRISLRLDDDHPALALDASWDMGSFSNRLPFNGTLRDRNAVGTLGDSDIIGGDLRITANMGDISIR